MTMQRPLHPLHERRRPTRRVAVGLAAAAAVLLAAIALVDASPPVASPTAFELDGPGKNTHAPCFWANPADPGASLLFATAKDSGLVEVFNATTGALVGAVPGFGRPNNCTVEGDLLLTTDETAHDVVVHHVPDLTLMRTFGQDMIVPQGIDVLTRSDGQRLVYVIDSGNASVHVYDLATGAPVRSFATGFGLEMEPILADDRYQRIFIARQDATTGPRGIGIFSSQGTYLGEFGSAAFSRDPEGMALYACGDGGYIVAADQMTTATQFEVFDRVTLQHVGTFEIEDGSGDFTDSTDGVAILQTPLPGFPNGVFAACDGCGSTLPEEVDVIGWDRIASVLGLNVCPGGAAPDCITTPCVQRQLVSADAYVSSAAPDTNLGSDPNLRVDADPLDQTLLRFEVPDLTGFDLRQAVVQLTVDVGSGASSVAGGTLYLASGAWDERTVTFNTRPQPVGQPIASTGAVTEGQVVDFDVSPVMHGPGTYDFILLSASRDGARYRSREAGQTPPALLLTLHRSSPPEVQITSPADGTIVASGALLTLSATASDPEDGNLSSAIRWRSDLDGALGVGTPRTVTLRPGLHTITAEVTDQAHLSASASVRVSVGSAPVVTISEPADGTSVPGGTPLVLWGSAVDAEDGELSAGLRWESDRDGPLGTGTALVVTLSEGTHRLTASVADSGGAVGRAAVTVIVTPAPPVVRIGSPVDGSAVVAGESVTLRGSALDFADGDLGSRLTWQSSLQGPLGTGASLLVASLQVGTHVITASVTDSAGLTGQAAVTLRVAPATLTVAPAADTYVGSDVPDQNFGHDTTLQADHSPDRQSFLRFIVSGTQGLRIDQASLRLTVSSATASESDSGGTLYAIGDTGWQEETLTYRTRPPIDGPALGTLGPVAKGQLVTFDVTSAVPGDGTRVFALATASSNAVKYRSRETTSGRPTLVLTLHSQPIVNAAPTVRITAPTDGSSVAYGTPVLFSATAADDQDGDLSHLITWSSSLEGPLGTGPFIVKSLGAGTHVVTAAVIDSEGLTGSQ
jgi:myo-inositol-hexaphosphate 3-phosphohydrolase